MPNEKQLAAGMREWLTTEGLHPAEEGVIRALLDHAERGEVVFMAMAEFLYQSMPDVVLSAITKARTQGKCKEWPSA